MSSRISVIRCVSSVVALLTIASFAGAQQEPKKVVVTWEGTEAFRRFLAIMDQEPIKSEDQLAEVDAKETTIIVFGDPASLQWINRQVGGLRNFVNNGGALLIATHDPMTLEWGRARVVVTDQPLQQSPTISYQQNPACPKLRPMAYRTHPLFKNVAQGIATNSPNGLILIQGNDFFPDLRTLAYCERGHLGVIAPGRFGRGPRFAKRPAIVGSDPVFYRDHRFLMLSGHGVFVNGMMVQTDNDNFQFAHDVLEWMIKHGRNMPRKYVLFVEDGTIHQNFRVALARNVDLGEYAKKLMELFRQNPVGTIRMMLQVAAENPQFTMKLLNSLRKPANQILVRSERALGRLESQDPLNGLIDRFGHRPGILQAMVGGLTIIVLFIGTIRILRSRRSEEKNSPLMERIIAGRGGGDAPAKNRREGAARCGSVWDAANLLARQWWTTNVRSDYSDRPPRVEANNANKRWQRIVNSVWQIVTSKPRTMSPKQLQRLLDDLRSLDAAKRAGDVRVAED